MSEVQKHGFIFEDWVKLVLGVDNLAVNYTQKWDIPGELPISVKCMGFNNALEFGSAIRIWEIDKPFTLVLARWEQCNCQKRIISIDEITITLDNLKEMKGDITLEELREFDRIIKRFRPGKDGQKEGILFAKNWKRERAGKMGLLTITHKIDSKAQRRVQCNLNFSSYLKLFGNPSMNVSFRGASFNDLIDHGPRVFNRD